MAPTRNEALAAAGAVVLCVACVGCSDPTRQFLTRRGSDLADCFKANAGCGLPVYARAKVTDFAVAGAGLALGFRGGWHGRYGGEAPAPGGINAERGLPLIVNTETALYPTLTTPSFRIETIGPCCTTREYARVRKPGPRAAIAEKFWIGGIAVLLVAAQVEFNPAEFADFLTGWAGWDMLMDDTSGGPDRGAVC